MLTICLSISHNNTVTKLPKNYCKNVFFLFSDVCEEEPCKEFAIKFQLLTLADHKSNPCNNFYKYTCNQTMHEDYFESLYDQMLNLVSMSEENYLNHFRDFQDSCVMYYLEYDSQKRENISEYDK